jgi:hypothetical protein
LWEDFAAVNAIHAAPDLQSVTVAGEPPRPLDGLRIAWKAGPYRPRGAVRRLNANIVLVHGLSFHGRKSRLKNLLSFRLWSGREALPFRLTAIDAVRTPPDLDAIPLFSQSASTANGMKIPEIAAGMQLGTLRFLHADFVALHRPLLSRLTLPGRLAPRLPFDFHFRQSANGGGGHRTRIVKRAGRRDTGDGTERQGARLLKLG